MAFVQAWSLEGFLGRVSSSLRRIEPIGGRHTSGAELDWKIDAPDLRHQFSFTLSYRVARKDLRLHSVSKGGQFQILFDNNAVFQSKVRQRLSNALLGQLFEVVTADLTSKDPPFGIQLDGQVTDSPSRPISHLPFQKVS